MYAIYDKNNNLIQDGFYYHQDAGEWASEHDLDVDSFYIKRYSYDPDCDFDSANY
jgi:hypothetical protein